VYIVVSGGKDLSLKLFIFLQHEVKGRGVVSTVTARQSSSCSFEGASCVITSSTNIHTMESVTRDSDWLRGQEQGV
jgi:diphthamide synthase (EF-2-diphthine--ammonia ligase)